MECHVSNPLFLGSKLRILVFCCSLFAFLFDVFCLPYKPNKPTLCNLRVHSFQIPAIMGRFSSLVLLIVDNVHCTISVLCFEGNCTFHCNYYNVLVFLNVALGIKTSSEGSVVSEIEPIGVFWDIENCPVPRGMSALAVVQKIRKKFFTGKREAEFMCVCDVGKMKKEVIEELNKAQVNLTK